MHMDSDRERFDRNPASRRTFLHGLVTLPLIGGSVTLIGNPTAAAVPVSRVLLANYEAWLAWERFRLHREMWSEEAACHHVGFLKANGPIMRWHSPLPDEPRCPEPSTRAAVILSAAGVPLAGGRHG